MFSNVDIKRAMTAYAEELAQSHIDFHMHFPVSGLDDRAETLQIIADLREAVRRSEYPEATMLAVCKIMGVVPSFDADSIELMRACREYSLATIGVQEEHVKRLEGREVFKPFVPIEPATSAGPAAPVAPPSTPLISEVLEPFLSDKQSGKPVKIATVKAYRANVASVIEILGDVPVGSITYDDVTRLRDVMLRLPKNRNRAERYKDLTLDEILAMNIPERELIGGRSVKETLNYTKSLYKWLVRRSTVTLNPFEGVMTATSSQSYEPFTDTQVSNIFSSELYTSVPALTTTPGHWWLLLMSLYSGARPSELVQLTLDDVVEEQGVLVMRIVADEAKGQSVKTKAGQRVVPVHPKLLELGFADFIENSRVAGEERVLHGISKGNAQSGGPAGVWFKRYKQFHLPELEEQRKPLYSFRSTFVTHALNVANIDLAYVQQIVGHERSQMGTTRVYDAGGDAKRLFEEISKVKFKPPPIKPVTA